VDSFESWNEFQQFQEVNMAMNKKIQEQVLKEFKRKYAMNVAQMEQHKYPHRFLISRTIELMEEEKKLDICSICKIEMGKEMITKECPNCYVKGCNLELKKQKADFRKMIEKVFEENRKASQVIDNKHDPIRLKILLLCGSIEQILLTKLDDDKEVENDR